MEIALRMRKIREMRGLNQSDMALKMKISPQSYRQLEKKGNIKFSSIQKFCRAVNVQPSFLLTENIPITEDMLKFFDLHSEESFFTGYERLKIKAQAYEKLLV